MYFSRFSCNGNEIVCDGSPDVQIFPYPNDCRMFLVCMPGAPGSPAAHGCLHGQYFNIEANVCVEGECENSTTETTTLIPETTTTATTTIPPTTTTIPPTITTTTPSSTTTRDPNVEDGIYCPLENGLIYLPSNIECDRYYVCLNGDGPFPNRCRSGLHWNQVEQSCDFIEMANCPVSIVQTISDLLLKMLVRCYNLIFINSSYQLQLEIQMLTIMESCFVQILLQLNSFHIHLIADCSYHATWDFVQLHNVLSSIIGISDIMNVD